MTSRGRAFAYFLKPRSGVFIWAARPQSGAFAAFQTKKKDKCPTNARKRKQDRHAWNWLSHYWTEIGHNDQSNSTYQYWSENMGIQRRFFGTKADTLFLSHFPHLFLYQESWKKKKNNSLVGNIIHRDLWGWTFFKKNYSASYTIACHPITSITSVTSESTGR